MVFFVLFLVLSIQTTLFAGNVVFLHAQGASVGRTTICKELEKHGCCKVVDEDVIVYKEAPAYWREKFLVEFAAIDAAIAEPNLLHAVMRNQILFRASASALMREKARDAIRGVQNQLNNPQSDVKEKWSDPLRNEIIRMVIDLAKDHNVVVETWFLKEEHIKEIAKKCAVKHVLVHCSLEEVVRRNLKRNCEAAQTGSDISNMRFFHQALAGSYVVCDLCEEPSGAVDVVNKESISRALNMVEMHLHNDPHATGASCKFTRGEFSLEDFQQYRNDLMSKFKAEKMGVVSKLPYDIDMVVNTYQKDPATCAKEIMQAYLSE